MKNKKPARVLLASIRNSVATEGLPLPRVYYPVSYGTFFAFSEPESDELYFCSCAEDAIRNYLDLKQRNPGSYGRYDRPTGNALLDDRRFPLIIASKSLTYPSSVSWIKFKEKLCHICNKRIPSFHYCVPMYGTVFKQNFGWYVNQTAFELGYDPSHHHYLQEKCPAMIQETIDHARTIANELNMVRRLLFPSGSDLLADKNLTDRHEIADEFIRLENLYNKQRGKINREAENLTRERLGYKNIGEGWDSETIVFKIVKQLIGDNHTVIHHAHPKWLEGLELDIFVPSLAFAIEYQGEQHFHPITAWGGQNALDQTQLRDKKKKVLCKANGIILIYINYYDAITEENISQKMATAGIHITKHRG